MGSFEATKCHSLNASTTKIPHRVNENEKRSQRLCHRVDESGSCHAGLRLQLQLRQFIAAPICEDQQIPQCDLNSLTKFHQVVLFGTRELDAEFHLPCKKKNDIKMPNDVV